MADRIEGLSIGLGLDTVNIDSGLKDIKRKFTLLNSEVKNNMSAFDRGEKSVEKYTTQLTGLNKKISLSETSTAAARKQYEKMVEVHGESSKKAEDAAIKYNNESSALNNLKGYVDNVTKEFKDFEEQQRVTTSAFGKMSDSFEKAGGKFKKIGDGMKTAGTSLTTYLSAPIALVGGIALKAAGDFDTAQGKMQAQLGITAEEAEVLGDVAQELWKNNFGENIGEVTEAVAGVRQVMGDLSDKELKEVAEGAFIIRDAFGAEINETTRTASVLIKTFGIDGTEALDLITTGFQRGGDFSGELMDSLREYAPQFEGMGYSAEEFTAILVAGAETGAFNLDKVGDAGKEAFLRIGEGSKGSRIQLGLLGLDFDQIETDINSGGDSAKTAFAAVASAIAGVKDPAKKTQAAIALIGTPIEDLGPEFQDFFATVNTDLGEFEGATKEAGDALYDNLGARAQTAWRELQTAMLPAGEALLVVAEDILPKVSKGVETLSEWFEGMTPTGRNVALAFAGIAAAAGPVLLVVGTVASAFGGMLTLLGTVTGAISIMGTTVAAGTPAIGAMAGAFTLLTGPVGLGIAAIAGVVVAGGLLVNHLKKDVIPEVDRFGVGISDSTKEALGGFFELSDKASGYLMDLQINSGVVSDEMATKMIGAFQGMNDQILTSMKTSHEEQLEETRTFFETSIILTDEEEQKIIEEQKIKNDRKAENQQDHMDAINRILQLAADENRELTTREKEVIENINKEMQETAVAYLTESEIEQTIIMERMKQSAGDLSAQQAAAVVKNSAKQRDGVIADAEETYDGSIAEIIRMRDEAGTITAEQATLMIAEAKRTRDTTVDYAEDMHDDVVEEAKLQAKEHVGHVNWETGEILSKWDVYKKGVLKRVKETNKESMADFKRWGSDYLTWSAGFRSKAFSAWDDYKDGVKSRFNKSTQEIYKGVNNVVSGVNWVLGKLGVSAKIPFLTVSSSGGSSSSKSSKGATPAYAQGTDSHPGGMAWLSDGKGRNAGQELVQTPDGNLSLSPKKQSLVDLPKGSKVLSAEKTKGLLEHPPHYAFGVGDFIQETYNSTKGLAKKAGKKLVSTAFDVYDYMKNPSKLLDVALSALGVSSPGGSGFIGNMAKGAFNKVKSGAVGYIKNKLADFGGGSGGKGAGFGSAFRKTSSYGMRFDPFTGRKTMHNGDDYGAASGTPIPSQAGGRVTYSGFHGLRGNYVRVQSGDMARIYQHNSRNLVGVGDAVKAGQTVGTVGSTGASTGAHLHYEVLRNGSPINPNGFANGGLITKEQMAMVGEGNKAEMVIPLDPAKRTNAMKLLALTGKMLGVGGKGGSVSPSQMKTPAASGDNQIIELLKQQVLLLQSLIANPQLVTVQIPIDGQVIAEKTLNVNQQLFGSASKSNDYMNGVR